MASLIAMAGIESVISSFAVERIAPAIGRGDLILIGGLARLGKSTLASAIAETISAFDLSAIVVSLDSWILPANERVMPGVENRFDIQSALSTLAPWLGPRLPLRCKLPEYDRQMRTRRLEAVDLDLAADAVLILEGVPALLLPISTERAVHRIYVQGDEAGRRDRVISDLLARGIQSRELAERIYQERQIDETPHIEGSAIRADYFLRLD